MLFLAWVTPVVSAESDSTNEDIGLPPAESILNTLRPEHPRVLVQSGTFAELDALVHAGGLPARIYGQIKKSADKMLDEPVSIYEKRDGRRLLFVSREVLNRVQALALVYQLEGDQRYRDRAWKELAAAAAFPDWNPAHFLDTAEMTYGFALGYDWLYDQWTEKQRRLLVQAIVTKGLRPGLAVYEGKPHSKGWRWDRNPSNWNQVCNGGLMAGALAVADVEPHLAARIVSEAATSVTRAMRHYLPDGSGSEGVTYWGYGSKYNVVLMAAMENALGTDFGLSQTDGFEKSGYYQIYLSGPNHKAFDFADCELASVSEPQHFWMARHYDVPAFSWFRLKALESGAQSGRIHDLLWYDDRGRDYDPASLPVDRYFRGSECASMRSSWGPEALTVAIQAGKTANLGGHRHLDLGSFILDALGERWIIDSGKDWQTYMRHENNHPRHFFYCVRAEGHNVPVINSNEGPDQNPKASAEFVKFSSAPDSATAVVNLTEAYQPHASGAQRTFVLEHRKRLVLTDELELREPSELWWFLHTEAEVTLKDQGRTALLAQNGKKLVVRLEHPANAVFEVMAATPLPTSPKPAIQKDMSRRRKLALHLINVKTTTIQASLEPVAQSTPRKKTRKDSP